MTAERICQRAQELCRGEKVMVVLTGGEPSLQADAALTILLHAYGFYIAMETNGTNPIPDGVDFVTCSPKCDFVNDYKVIKGADEVKVVYDGQHSPARWLREIAAQYYYLQPCDTGDEKRNREIITECVEYVKRNPTWRLSLQTQKILNIR